MNTLRIRVAVIDDHPLFREGVVQTISSCADMDVVAQGASAAEALEIVRGHDPDIVILDINIPGGGIVALEQMMAGNIRSRVMMLTVSTNQVDAAKSLRLGARGYVVKGVAGPELIEAVRAVFNGEHYLSPSLGARLVANAEADRRAPQADASSNLSSREVEILSLVRLGHSNKAIAKRLNLSDKTVKHYMTGLFQKLKVRNRVEAALLGTDGEGRNPASEDDDTP
jgi:DNA-binding NarL/FixJ family response regulator